MKIPSSTLVPTAVSLETGLSVTSYRQDSDDASLSTIALTARKRRRPRNEQKPIQTGELVVSIASESIIDGTFGTKLPIQPCDTMSTPLLHGSPFWSFFFHSSSMITMPAATCSLVRKFQSSEREHRTRTIMDHNSKSESIVNGSTRVYCYCRSDCRVRRLRRLSGSFVFFYWMLIIFCFDFIAKTTTNQHDIKNYPCTSSSGESIGMVSTHQLFPVHVVGADSLTSYYSPHYNRRVNTRGDQRATAHTTIKKIRRRQTSIGTTLTTQSSHAKVNGAYNAQTQLFDSSRTTLAFNSSSSNSSDIISGKNFSKDFPWVDLGRPSQPTINQPEYDVSPAPISTERPTLRPTPKPTTSSQKTSEPTSVPTKAPQKQQLQTPSVVREEEEWVKVQAPIYFAFSIPSLPDTKLRRSRFRHRTLLCDQKQQALDSSNPGVQYSRSPCNSNVLLQDSLDSRQQKSQHHIFTVDDVSRVLDSKNSSSVLQNIEVGVQEYLIGNLKEAFKDQTGLTVANVSVDITRLDTPLDKGENSNRKRNLDQQSQPQRKRILQDGESTKNSKEIVTLKVMGSAEYIIDERVITIKEVLDHSEDIVTKSVADKTVLQRILNDAGVDTNSSDILIASNSTPTTSSIEESNNSESTQEKPTLVELVCGLVLLGLTIISLLFWAGFLYKKFMKRRRKKRLAALRKNNSITIGGGNVSSRRTMYDSMEMNRKTSSGRPVGGYPPKMIPHATTRSNEDVHLTNGDTSRQTMTVLSLSKIEENGGGSDDGDNSYYQGMIGGTSSSNASDEDGKQQQQRKLTMAADKSSNKNFTSVVDQLDQLVASTAVSNTKTKAEPQHLEEPASGNDVGVNDITNHDDDSAGVLLSSYSRFLLGTPTSAEENEVLNRSFPYGDEDFTRGSSKKKTHEVRTTPPLASKSSNFGSGGRNVERENVELTVNDAVEWTDTGMIKITVGGGPASVKSASSSITNGKRFTPYGDDEHNIPAENDSIKVNTVPTTTSRLTLAESWDLDENPVKDDSPPAQYSFVYPLKRQDVHSAGDSSLLSSTASSGAAAIHESPDVTTIGSNTNATSSVQQQRQASSTKKGNRFNAPGGKTDRLSVAAVAAALLRSAGINLDDDGISSDDSSISDTNLAMAPDNDFVTNDNRSDLDDNDSQHAASLTESMVQEVNQIAQYVENYESSKQSIRSSILQQQSDDAKTLSFIEWKTKTNNSKNESGVGISSKQQQEFAPLGIKPKELHESPGKSYVKNSDRNRHDLDDDDSEDDDEVTNATNATNNDEESQRLGISRYQVEIPPLVQGSKNPSPSPANNPLRQRNSMENATGTPFDHIQGKKDSIVVSEQSSKQQGARQPRQVREGTATESGEGRVSNNRNSNNSGSGLLSNLITMFEGKKTSTPTVPSPNGSTSNTGRNYKPKHHEIV